MLIWYQLKIKFSSLPVPGTIAFYLLQEWTIDLKGNLSPSKRSCFWKSKRVFFVTPQVLQNDIQSGDYFSCLSNCPMLLIFLLDILQLYFVFESSMCCFMSSLEWQVATKY